MTYLLKSILLAAVAVCITSCASFELEAGKVETEKIKVEDISLKTEAKKDSE